MIDIGADLQEGLIMDERKKHAEAYPGQNWITMDIPPVVETQVIATVRRHIGDHYMDIVTALGVMYLWDTGEPAFYSNDKRLTLEDGYEVLAWLPLPEPYKEDNES